MRNSNSRRCRTVEEMTNYRGCATTSRSCSIGCPQPPCYWSRQVDLCDRSSSTGPPSRIPATWSARTLDRGIIVVRRSQPDALASSRAIADRARRRDLQGGRTVSSMGPSSGFGGGASGLKADRHHIDHYSCRPSSQYHQRRAVVGAACRASSRHASRKTSKSRYSVFDTIN